MELLEREQLLTQLEEHLRQAAAGHGRVVLVGGEAGVGKTALVDEFCRRVAGVAPALRASCDALSTPGPLGPVRDLAPRSACRSSHTRLTAIPATRSSGAFSQPLAHGRARRSWSARMRTGPTAPPSNCCGSWDGALAGCAPSSSSPTVTTRSDPIIPSVWSWVIWRQRRPSTASACHPCRRKRYSAWQPTAGVTPPPCTDSPGAIRSS